MTHYLRVLFVAAATLAPATAIADGLLVSWGGNSIPGMTQERWDKAKGRSPQEILKLNLTAKAWADCYEVALGANSHEDNRELARQLVDQLQDPTVTRLSGTSRLIIWERIAQGEILFEGKGYQVEDDLFSVAGRANWVLRTITGKNLGHVKPDSTVADLQKLQARWSEFMDGGTPTEWEPPYGARQAGLSEIRSLSALEALIVSLRASRQKEELTKTCLRDLYGLEEMPAREGMPARTCSPDTYTHFYLATLTGVDEIHSADWWAAWWQSNKEELVWSGETGQFLIPGAEGEQP